MSFKGYIGVWKVLAAGASGAGVALGLVGVVESLYHSPGSLAALLFGFGLYALVGIVWGVVVALLFGGKARNNREDLVRMTGRIAAVPTALLILVAGAQLIYHDVWSGSASGADLTGWLAMLTVPLLALAGAWFARLLGRSLADSTLVAPAVIVPLVLLGTLLSGWLEESPAPELDLSGRAPDESRPPVILVVADGLRADVTGPYGGSADTPNLDAFAEEAVLFGQAWSSSSRTRPAVASIFTGRYPSGHRVTGEDDRLPADLPTLAGLLKDSGYVTLASVGNRKLRSESGLARGFEAYASFLPGGFLNAPAGTGRLFLLEVFGQLRRRLGFSKPEVARYYARGERVLGRGRALMDQALQVPVPFFAYLHFMETHEPFFAHPDDGQALDRAANPHPPVERAREFFDRYRQEVSHIDGLFGELILYLKEAGCYQNSLILVTADHGQEFADHQGFWHGSSLYQEAIHVPLLVRFPGGAGAGTVQDQPVSVIDLLPTVLGTLGMQMPQVPGRSLTPLPKSDRSQRTLVAELAAGDCLMAAVRDSRYKLIRANAGHPRGLPGIQLFDLQSDPNEQDDLASRDPSTVARLQAILNGKSPGSSGEKTADPKIDPQTEEQLRSLGYTQ